MQNATCSAKAEVKGRGAWNCLLWMPSVDLVGAGSLTLNQGQRGSRLWDWGCVIGLISEEPFAGEIWTTCKNSSGVQSLGRLLAYDPIPPKEREVFILYSSCYPEVSGFLAHALRIWNSSRITFEFIGINNTSVPFLISSTGWRPPGHWDCPDDVHSLQQPATDSEHLLCAWYHAS